MELSQDYLKMLEAPWLKRQVEGHLVFGVLARTISLGKLLIGVSGIAVLYLCLSPGSFSSYYLSQLAMLAWISFLMTKMTAYQQAALGWWVTKVTLFLVSVIALAAGGLAGFIKGSPDAWHITILALLWLPLPEFIPSITAKQKYLTTAVIAVSVPIVLLWRSTGTWK